MKNLAFGIFVVFLQTSIFLFGHYSQLIKIYDTSNHCYIELDALKNLRKDSNFEDKKGVCYGTHGAATRQTGPFQSLPRCHSEFFLFNKIKQNIQNLENLKIWVQNELFPPCKLHRGETKRRGTELNPGIPCDEYLRIFAQDNKCQILIQSPRGEVEYLP